jgi:ABC-type transport system substrate-binding protein
LGSDRPQRAGHHALAGQRRRPAGRAQGASVDGIDDVGPGGLETIESDVSMQAVSRPGLNTFYVGFNNTFALFDNPKVRQAIAMGIDRERLVAALFPPGSEVASHFSPCAIPLGCLGDPWYEFDPSAARQLLASAGFADGFETTIQHRDVARPYLPDPTAVASELQAQLLVNLGIRAELEVLPEATFLDTVDNGGADGIHLLGRVASIPEVSNLLDPLSGQGRQESSVRRSMPSWTPSRRARRRSTKRPAQPPIPTPTRRSAAMSR